MIELGYEVKDKVTGFKGIVTGRASYITGCDQYLIAPKNKGATFENSIWIDEGRLKVGKQLLKPEDVQLKESTTFKEPPRKGGPNMYAPKRNQ